MPAAISRFSWNVSSVHTPVFQRSSRCECLHRGEIHSSFCQLRLSVIPASLASEITILLYLLRLHGMVAFGFHQRGRLRAEESSSRLLQPRRAPYQSSFLSISIPGLFPGMRITEESCTIDNAEPPEEDHRSTKVAEGGKRIRRVRLYLRLPINNPKTWSAGRRKIPSCGTIWAEGKQSCTSILHVRDNHFAE